MIRILILILITLSLLGHELKTTGNLELTTKFKDKGVLSVYKDIINISPGDVVQLHIKKSFFDINCSKEDLPSNNLLIMCLRDTYVKYGDEGRTKQEHIFDETVYYNTLVKRASETPEYYVYNISKIIHDNSSEFINGILNNIFFTTKEARLYHYEKHSKNAFYHIQAINLPFHNILFNYVKPIF